jgi:hypothetical protein
MKVISLLCILLTGYACAGLEIEGGEEVYVIEHSSFRFDYSPLNTATIVVRVECIAPEEYASISIASLTGGPVSAHQQDISEILYEADQRCRWIGAYE